MNRTFSESGATFAIGIVSVVNAGKGWARVRLPDYDGLETAELPVLQRRTHKDKAMDLPDVGEQVAVLLDWRGEDGVILGAIWSEADPVPQSEGPDVDVRKYEDGTVLRYDRKAHKLTGEVRGAVDIAADEVVRVESKTKLELAAPATDIMTNALTVSGYGGKARSARSGGATQATLRGTFRVENGDVIVDGVSVKTHPHTGVEPGPGQTGLPVATA